jgi:hypothetical protein
MSIEDELVHAAAGGPAIEALEPSNPLQERSADELRAIASRGIHAGDLYFAAAAELERRARESLAEEAARKAEAAARRQHLILMAAGWIAVGTTLALVWWKL